MQNLLQLAGSGDISPTNIANANINGEEEEGLDGIVVDLMDHDAFNTNEMITMTGNDPSCSKHMLCINFNRAGAASKLQTRNICLYSMC